jgi:hypothetical protein
MSLAKNALCSSIAAAAVATTFFMFAPEPEALTAPAIAPRSMAGEVVPTRKSVKVVVSSTDSSCPKVRRRFWVEGEGWIVRRVGICQ